MSEAKRYKMRATAEFDQDAWTNPIEDANGGWVRYDDYAQARREALEKAFHMMPRYFGVWSLTGVHIGVWEDGKIAADVLAEYPGGVMRDLIDASDIRALIEEHGK